MNIRTQLAALEATVHKDDELMARVIDALKDHVEATDELEALERYRSIRRSAAASFMVEAQGLLREEQSPHLRDLLFGRMIAPAWHQ